MLKARFLASINDINPGQWDSLFGSRNPFIQHAFLQVLEDSGSAVVETGWRPQHLVLYSGEAPVGAMPLYLKSHSWGEFVFDWGWAEAYERHGLDYYPKLLTAIPFTPTSGPRIGTANGQNLKTVIKAMLCAIRQLAGEQTLSGWHLLFPDQEMQELLGDLAQEHHLLRRQDVQFHWFNRGYGSIDDFMATLRSARRKNLKRERRHVAEQGVTLERITGGDITDGDWNAFYRCYISTYLKRSGHGGYLTREFFDRLREVMPDQLMLVVARREDAVAACALFLFDSETLYGRYWGSLEDIHCLHFEACFYQGIEFCIERGIAKFDPGTQGEHKLMRGFEPVKMASYHWIADPRFRAAIADFLTREQHRSEAYTKLASRFLPYKKNR